MRDAALEKLKQLVSAKTERTVVPCSLVPSGIPQGAITEISGHGKTEFVLNFLRENNEHYVAWIEKNFSAYPFGFLQKEIDLGRVLFMEGQKELDWCVYQALRAQVFQTVVVYCDHLDLKSLRRIQLQSEKSLACTLWLTTEPKQAWPVHLRLSIERNENGLSATTLKQRT